MRAINPTTEELIRDYPDLPDQEVEKRLEQAENTFHAWRKSPFQERSAVLRRLNELLLEGTADFAPLMTAEMGKPIAQAEAEIEKCAWNCRYYAEQAESFLSLQNVTTDAATSYVRYDPLGVLLAIMPWNFPFWQVFRFAAPALMAGNVVLLKHAPNVPGCAHTIEKLFQSASELPGLLTNLAITNDQTAKVIASPIVRGVTLTGSEKAGRTVAAQAGKHIKKTVLELGGSDPFIVLADADLPKAAQLAVKARTQNTGQSCIAAKRFIVEDSIADRFEQALAELLDNCSIGDPLDRNVKLGPIARLDLLENLQHQVDQTVKEGAKLVLGGKRPKRKGYFYLPTLLTHVESEMTAFMEETFGPVATVIRASNTDHAIKLANRSGYGLGASVWTSDLQKGQELASEIEAGVVGVNEAVKSDPPTIWWSQKLRLRPRIRRIRDARVHQYQVGMD